MPDADAAWRCPRGCDPCVHFDAALRKDIVDDMLHKYGFDFKVTKAAAAEAARTVV